MQSIIYDVAVSIDGYIAGPDGDVSKFAHVGAVVDDYRDRLAGYACAIMGRKTYEFGYRYGLEPGGNPYPGLTTIVVSRSIELPIEREVNVMQELNDTALHDLRETQPGPIYLCGGGCFAGALLAAGQIDMIRLKRAPILLGGGTPLFENAGSLPDLQCAEEKPYGDGYLYQALTVARP